MCCMDIMMFDSKKGLYLIAAIAHCSNVPDKFRVEIKNQIQPIK